jgi:hypothetical protein
MWLRKRCVGMRPTSKDARPLAATHENTRQWQRMRDVLELCEAGLVLCWTARLARMRNSPDVLSHPMPDETVLV